MTGPSTRDLREVVVAIGITKRELQYQVQRLRNGLAKPQTPEEATYLKGLADEYEAADAVLSKLWGYQTHRIERQEAVDREGGLVQSNSDGRVAVGRGDG